MAEDKSRTEQKTPEWGADPDSRLRELKRQMALAESTGDDKGADRLRREVDALNVELGRKDKADAKSDKATG